MADHPLRPATDRRLGGPLPHQQANPTQAHPSARAFKKRPSLSRKTYAVLIRVSPGYPPHLGRFLRVTHPSATLLVPEGTFAFDLHVLSIPPAFNLSQDQTLQFNLITVRNFSFTAKNVCRNSSRQSEDFEFRNPAFVKKHKLQVSELKTLHSVCVKPNQARKRPHKLFGLNFKRALKRRAG